MRRALRNRNAVERANMEDLIKDNTILFINHLQSHSFYETLQKWKENRHIIAHIKQFLRFGLFLIFLKIFVTILALRRTMRTELSLP